LPIICEILDLHTTASMYPAISIARLMDIPVVVPKPSVREQIVAKVRAALKARAEAERRLEKATAEVEGVARKGGK
jgi:type I restriction enzyme M protein